MYIVIKKGKGLCGNRYTSSGYQFRWNLDLKKAKRLLKYLAVVAAKVANGKIKKV